MFAQLKPAASAQDAPKHVVIVSPAYNERESIPELLSQIDQVVAGLNYRFSVLLVDDGSDEDAAALLDEAVRDRPGRAVIHLARNFGQQAALTAGLDEARRQGADAVICMDSDLQHPPRLLPELLARWEAGYDVVYGVREDAPHVGWFKRLASRAFYALIGVLADHGAALPGTADFRLLARPALEALTSLRERGRFLRGLTVWIGFRQVGVRYRPDPRFAGESKFTLRKMLRLALDGLVATTTRPLRAVLLLGMAVSLVALTYTAYVVLAYFLLKRAVPGWSSVMVAVMVLGSMNLCVLGVIGLYLARIFEEVKGRPIYIVRGAVGGARDDR